MALHRRRPGETVAAERKRLKGNTGHKNTGHKSGHKAKTKRR